MFKFSFNSLITGKKEIEDYPLISSLDFGQLTAMAEEIEEQPILCVNCNSAIVSSSELEEKDGEYQYQCRFCLNVNKIDKATAEKFLEITKGKNEEDQLSMAELSFLLDVIRGEKEVLEEMEIKELASSFGTFIAVIDVSGSMGSGKLEAVKHSLVQSVHSNVAKNPKTDFILITFDCDVAIFLHPNEGVVINDGPIFFKVEDMEKEIKKILKSQNFNSIESLYKEWTSQIKSLRPGSTTALGPALYMANRLIVETQDPKKPVGGRILLLTDGLANVGIGAVESFGGIQNQDGDAAGFYNSISQQALKNNVVVDMVGVRDRNGRNSVALDIIGKVTDYTGGQMLFVRPDQIEAAFKDFQKTSYIARNVTLRVYAPDFIELAEIEGAELIEKLPKKSGAPISLGAFYPDRELFLKFKPKSSKALKKLKDIPIQLQLEYLDAQNLRRVRVFRRTVNVTEDMEEFKNSYNLEVATGYEMAKASNIRRKGEIARAKKILAESKTRNMALQSGGYSKDTVETMNALLDDEMEEWDEQESMMEAENVADQRSFLMSHGQALSRSSYSAKRMRYEKKRKK